MGVDKNNMGMTDKQFNCFVRFVLDDIKEVIQLMKDSNKENTEEFKKLQKVENNLQQTIED